MTHDTTVYYNYHVYSSCGKDIDSTVALTFRALFTHIDTTICDNHPVVIGTTSLNETGTQTLTLTTEAQCDSVVEVSLTAHPHYDIQFNESVCGADGFTIDDTTYYKSGTYQYKHTTDFGCDSIITLHLNILSENLKAEFKAIPPIVTPTNLDIRLYDCSHASTSCRWIIEENEYLDRYLTHTFPADADSLPVTLLAYSADNCIDTTTQVIYIDRSSMFTPNVFTPGEGTNNTWQPGMNDIIEMELWIYNREGLLVCHLEGIDAQWDGTRNGTPCPQGSYVYTLLYKSKVQPEKQKKVNGTILLLR
jgi:gliding motility-associated-like protein